MKLSRRDLLKAALGVPAATWLLNYRAAAAPHAGEVKITKIKTMGLDNLGDGCDPRIERRICLVRQPVVVLDKVDATGHQLPDLLHRLLDG